LINFVRNQAFILVALFKSLALVFLFSEHFVNIKVIANHAIIRIADNGKDCGILVRIVFASIVIVMCRYVPATGHYAGGMIGQELWFGIASWTPQRCGPPQGWPKAWPQNLHAPEDIFTADAANSTAAPPVFGMCRNSK
jgi:hypothetical protein